MGLPVVAVIMAGGVGERFWPHSRKNSPKQLLDIFGTKPLIKSAVDRLKPLVSPDKVYISTGSVLERKIRSVLPKVNYVVEPMSRNTAACIGLSAVQVIKDHGDAIMIIETADHMYADTAEYICHIKMVFDAAKLGRIVLTGIKPTQPHTGYGYIQQGVNWKNEAINRVAKNIFEVKQFKEKPDFATAKRYLKSGDYLWNSGMFVAKASVLLAEIKKHMPKLSKALKKISDGNIKKKVLKDEFERLDDISIDYGVLEKSSAVVVAATNLGWDDVGDWNSLERHFKVKDGNVSLGNHLSVRSKGCIVVSNKSGFNNSILSKSVSSKVNGSKKLIATLGLEDVVIVDTDDALLVMSKKEAANLKDLVKVLPKRLT